jgi:hypothetical protein
MNNNLLQLKIYQRLNKLASFDYDNIECWKIVEAFNKAQLEWVRRQIDGLNQKREGDESTKMRIDDLQNLLVETPMTGSSQKDLYFQTRRLSTDYLYYKGLTFDATSKCCPNKKMVVYLAEVADVSNYLYDSFRKPSLEWGETFATIQGNRIRIYHNDEFGVANANLTYYRKPVYVTFANCVDPGTGNPTTDVECEFKDDIVEILIDETAAILAGDIEAMNQLSRNKQNAQINT